MTMTVGSLFSGIGGLELGLEWAGMRTIWQVEKDEYCRRILNKHWPDVPVYDDVTEVAFHTVHRTPDVICGGFPCQDISLAGKGAGIEGERSGLWWEMHRAIRVLRPRYAVIENVPALTHRGLDAVLGSLAEIRYDAEWQIISAAAMGAPHIRERLFVVAYPNSDRRDPPRNRRGRGADHEERNGQETERGRDHEQSRAGESGSSAADSGKRRCRAEERDLRPGQPDADRGTATDTDSEGESQPKGTEREGRRRDRHGHQATPGAPPKPDDESSLQASSSPEPIGEEGRAWNSTLWSGRHPESGPSERAPEPAIRGSDDGTTRRVDRLRALGNAVVPQVAEFVGRHVMRHAQ